MGRFVGNAKAQISGLGLPADFDARVKAEHVKQRAGSLKRIGMINLPIVNAATREVIAGRDRIAGEVVNGATAVEVRLFEGTPDECEELRLAEDIERRGGDSAKGDAEVRRYVDLVAKRLTANGAKPAPAKVSGQPDRNPGGRKKTVRAQAREEVAAATGKSAEAVRQADKRAAAKEAPEKKTAPPASDRPAPWWDELPSAGLRGEAMSNVGNLERFGELMVKAQANLTTIKLSAYGAHAYQRLYAKAHALADEARSLVPVAACPKCKGDETAARSCPLCKGLAMVTRQQLDAANKATPAPASKPAKGGKDKKLKVILPSGETFDPESEGGDF